MPNPTIISLDPIVSNPQALTDAFKNSPAPKEVDNLNSDNFVSGDGEGKFNETAKVFASNNPDILFVSEYFFDGVLLGSLIVFEKYLNATHYEIFKRNIFSKNTDFERILFIDADSLEKETKNFENYISSVLGIDLPKGTYYAILDTIIKEDRIYEYKMKAGFFPRNYKFEYEPIFESRDLVHKVPVPGAEFTIFSFAESMFGSPDYAWIISLMNESIPFFGRKALKGSLSEFSLSVNVPKDLNHVLGAIRESIHFFNIRNTFQNILNILKPRTTNELNEFYNLIPLSVDDNKGVLNFSNFKTRLLSKFIVFKSTLTLLSSSDVLAKDAISKKLPTVVIPSFEGEEILYSIEGLTVCLKRLNAILMFLLYAYENSEQINNIISQVNSIRAIGQNLQDVDLIVDATAAPNAVIPGVSDVSDAQMMAILKKFFGGG